MDHTAGYFQHYSALERESLVKGCDVSHWQFPVTWTTTKTQGDYVWFKGGGVTSSNFSARYIKVSSNGNTSNTTNVYNNLAVYDSSYVNRVLTSATVTSSTPPTAGALADFVDGNNATYVVIGTGPQWIKVDMGAVYSVKYLKLWMYYTDGRTFHDKMIQVSSDDITYYDLWNSATNGEVPEKSGGLLASAYTSMAKDSEFTSVNVAAARSAGLKVGAYWYKSPNYIDANVDRNSTAHAIIEATRFYDYIVATTGSALDMGDIMPMLDFENGLGNIYPAMTNDSAYEYIAQFISTFYSLSNRKCILYSAYYTVDNLATAGQQLIHSSLGAVGLLCPLWLAATAGADVYPAYSYTAFGGFTDDKWTVWQYSSDGNALGETWGMTSTDIDLNVLNGNISTIMPPERVANLFGIAGDTTASLSWNPLTNTDVVSYKIYKDTVLEDTVLSPDLTYVVTGLTNGVYYTFTVSGMDPWEEGPKSIPSYVIPTDGGGLSATMLLTYTPRFL